MDRFFERRVGIKNENPDSKLDYKGNYITRCVIGDNKINEQGKEAKERRLKMEFEEMQKDMQNLSDLGVKKRSSSKRGI